MPDIIDGRTGLFALFGDPVSHSKSPAMHNAAFEELGINSVYLAFRVPEGKAGEAAEAARTLGLRGFNVTMPHKQAIMEHLDSLDVTAELCGAVNTVLNRDGVLTGFNTDACGAVYAVRKMGISIPDSRAVILGLGGAGKAIVCGLAGAGCRSVTVAVRNAGDAARPGTSANAHALFLKKTEAAFKGLECRMIDIGEADALADHVRGADLLINATNLGMGKNKGLSPVTDMRCFHSGLCVMDAVYDPPETEFLRLARKAGARCAMNGLNMLIGQGIEAFRLFTGEEMPEETALRVISG